VASRFGLETKSLYTENVFSEEPHLTFLGMIVCDVESRARFYVVI